jgi:hypothetical protein
VKFFFGAKIGRGPREIEFSILVDGREIGLLHHNRSSRGCQLLMLSRFEIVLSIVRAIDYKDLFLNGLDVLSSFGRPRGVFRFNRPTIFS